jgi:Protein of unknown function (DUF4100)
LPNEDNEMHDVTMDDSMNCKHMAPQTEKDLSVPKSKPNIRPTLDNIIIKEKTDCIKKRASPTYHFASELQENVGTEVLYKSLMDKEITARLGDILGSSFKLCKRLQMATQTQCIPVKPGTAGSNKSQRKYLEFWRCKTKERQPPELLHNINLAGG